VFQFEFLTVTNQKIQTGTRPALGRWGTMGLEGRTCSRTLVTGGFAQTSPKIMSAREALPVNEGLP